MIRILKVPECFKILRRYVKSEHRKEFDELFSRVEWWINVNDGAVASFCDVGDMEYVVDLLATVRTTLGELKHQFNLPTGAAAFVVDTLVVMESDADLLTTHLIADARPEARIRLQFTPEMNIAYRRIAEDNPGSEMGCIEIMREWVMRLLEAMGSATEDEPRYEGFCEVERDQCWWWAEYLDLIQLMLPNPKYDLVLSGWTPDGVTLTFKRV